MIDKFFLLILCIVKIEAFFDNLPKDGCNRTLYRSSGSFGYNNQDINTTDFCQWRIAARSDEKIMLWINNMNIPKLPHCYSGYLEVRNGNFPNSPLLGRFCGDGPLDPIISTGRKMLISYLHNNLNSPGSFLAHYQSFCGGAIYVEDETHLKSHTSVGNYPADKKCFWYIEAPEKHRLVLHFEQFDLEYEEHCSFDSVGIFDGATFWGRLCGDEIPRDFTSTSNSLTVVFVSDSTVRKGGFLATIKSEYDECAYRSRYGLQLHGTNCELTCGGSIYVEDEFHLKSHESEGDYPPDRECIWHIEVAENHRISVDFEEFDLEYEEDCSCDYVEIFDGSTNNTTLLGKFCGDEIPRYLSSTSNTLTIKFVSNSDVEKRGFEAHILSEIDECATGEHNCAHDCNQTIFGYQCTCRSGYELQSNGRSCELPCGGPIYVEDEITLKSHESEGDYPPYRECTWYIEVPENHYISVHFEEFDLEYQEHCSFDYVAILDGSNNSATLLGRFCGHEIPRNFTSTSNSLTIKFVTDGSVQKRGFLATIKSEQDESVTNRSVENCELDCGGVFNASSGLIISPYFPENYPFNAACLVTCTWEVIAPAESVIVLNFNYFELEGNATHPKDKVEVFEKSDNSTKRIGSYSESILPNSIVSKTNKLQIHFISDGGYERTAFCLRYQTVVDHCSTHSSCHHNCETTLTNSSKCICEDGYELQENNLDCKKDLCHFEISSKSGVVFSPNYPNNYPPNLNCTWHFKTTPGHKLVIKFLDLTAEVTSGGRCYDYVSLYDGDSFNSSLLGTFCTLNNSIVKESTTNEMYLQFRTDRTNQFKGFRANYSSICNSTLKATSEEKYIFSHVNYSFTDYANNIDCEWTIVPTAGYRTILSIEVLDLENHSYCSYDYLEIIDGYFSRGKYCGNNKPSQEFVSNNNFKVRFHSDGSFTGKGFRIMYKSANHFNNESSIENF